MPKLEKPEISRRHKKGNLQESSLEKPLVLSPYKKRNWGGFRLGAGRNAKRPEDKRVMLSTTIAPETKAWFQAQWEKNRSNAGRIVDYLVAQIRETELD